VPAVKERPSFLASPDLYGSSNLTSPGIAEDPPSLERTDIGTPSWSDMPQWEQLRFLASRTESLRLRYYLGQESTGNNAVIVFTVAETPSVKPPPRPATPLPSLQDQIAAIRSSLSLQMKELAEAVGVERPTVYSWLNDRNTPHAANRDRLQALYRIARKWNRLSPTPLAKQLHEPDTQGVSIFSLLKQTPIPMPALDARLDQAAQCVVSQPPRPGVSVRELAAKHGIDLRRVADRQDEIDLETGKGFYPE
jgi:transcriptional regulator with XRE-family HTH domain